MLGRSDDPAPLVSLRGVEISLGGRRLLDGLDLEVQPGESVAITGPSGSGKTTLLHLIAGIVTPDSGEVDVVGRDLTGLSVDARAAHRLRHIGLVFQFGELLPELTVRENVSLPARMAGVDRETADHRSMRWLERVDLTAQADAAPATLSGGEAQRVAIARALASKPSVVLADEPTGALDERNGLTITALLIELTTAAGGCLVLVTHDPAVAERSDRELRLVAGRLVDGVRRS
jgi:ABC-type lipoprotein export system ATPase subunit